MSGHSKWANIRVKKTAQDARRGKIFTKYARLIEIAVREGGKDPASNVRLRALIDGAKSESVPNANIDRAIAKGAGEGKGEQMQELLYEAYGSGGTAIIIECLTDNRNRTLANVKTILDKHGGRMAGSGSVLWMFERKGLVIADLGFRSSELELAAAGNQVGRDATLEELELAAIDKGAEDVSVEASTVRIVTAMDRWQSMRSFLAQRGLTVLSAGLAYVPKQPSPPLEEATSQNVLQLVEALEADDDVSEVHTNV